MNWYIAVLKKYAVFDGRARRMEYWMFFLFNFIIAVVLVVGGIFLHIGPWLNMLYSLAVLIPGLAVSVRRLHDINKSGWWLLIALVPIVNLILLVFAFMDSQPGDNQYGPNPKGVAA